MSVNDPGLAPVAHPKDAPPPSYKEGGISATEEAPRRLSESSKDDKKMAGSLAEEDSPTDTPIAPDQFDPNFATGKYELWSYYVCWIECFISPGPCCAIMPKMDPA